MLRSYDEHKETSIPWTNRVPKSWLIQRGKSIFQNKKQLNTQKQCDNILSLTLKGVVNNSIDNPIGLVPKDYATYQIFEKDDLVFKLIDLENYQTSRVGLVHELGIMSPAYIRIALRKKDDFNIKYFFYQYYDLYLRRVFNQIGAGVRSTLSAKELLNIEILIPPREEQNQIVRFLDWKLAKINKLIQAKKKQIVLLNEQKQVIINNAVTKGLDPNVPMKDSGIEWIGQIPIHWNVIRLRGILSPVSIKNHPKLPLLSVLREKGVIVRDVKDKESNHNFIPDDLSGYKVVQAGQFVMNKMKAWQGSYGISPYTGIVSPAYFVFDVNVKNKDYFHYSIRSKVYVNFFAQASNGIRVGQWDLNISKMKDIPFIVPSEEEQTLIIDYIKRTSKDIEVAITRFSNEIKLLQEYRTRLISDVVTGKVDVRDIEIPEYEADSDETIDDEIDDNLVLDEEDGEMEVE